MTDSNLDANLYLKKLIKLYQFGDYSGVISLVTSIEGGVLDNAPVQNVIAAANVQLGRLEAAYTHYEKSLALNPKDPRIHNNLGVVFADLKYFPQALNCFNKAIVLMPDYSEPYFNIGNVYREQGLTQKAINKYQIAVQLEPKHIDANNNLGVELQKIGKVDEAIFLFNKLVSDNPTYASGFNNLGIAHKSQGRLDDALAYFAKAVTLSPNETSFWRNLGQSLVGLHFSKYDKSLEHIFISLLNKKNTHDPHMLIRTLLSFLRKNNIVSRNIDTFVEDPQCGKAYFNLIKDFSSMPLLIKLMELCPFPDLQFEKLFTGCRKFILFNLDKFEDNQESISFLIALAMQCYVNEYIYEESTEEKSHVTWLVGEVNKRVLANKNIDDSVIVIIACYRPLHQFVWASDLVKNNTLSVLFNRQFVESIAEKQIADTIPILKTITDDTSRLVQMQYEENSYPRWVNMALVSHAMTISELAADLELAVKISLSTIKQPKILVAGCGTGRHSLLTASRFKESSVTAIDLSLNSICYAKRKTDEFDINNIQFLQGDILDLADLNQKFDVVESVGVLHHMDQPEIGLEVLADILKTGGIMRLGLYSHRARRGVVEARELIAKYSSCHTIEEEIRRFRTLILDDDSDYQNKLSFVTEWTDFFSMSECRDLFFHVKENRFSLLQIKILLEKLELSFLGFEFNVSSVKDEFIKESQGRSSLVSLDAWHEFEMRHPDAFIGMYQFWVQKIA